MIAGVKIKLLRLGAFAYALFGPLRLFYFPDHPVGNFVSSESGKTIRTVSSDPVMVAWAAGGALLYVALVFSKPRAARDGVPSRARRMAGHLIDFVFFLLVFSAIGSLVPLCQEGIRAGHFAWSYTEASAASTDLSFWYFLWALFVCLATLALLVWYAALPLTRCGQTVGGFVMGVRIVSPFGHELRMTFPDAFRRALWEFRWVCSGGGKLVSITDPGALRWETPAVLVADE